MPDVLMLLTNQTFTHELNVTGLWIYFEGWTHDVEMTIKDLPIALYVAENPMCCCCSTVESIVWNMRVSLLPGERIVSRPGGSGDLSWPQNLPNTL